MGRLADLHAEAWEKHLPRLLTPHLEPGEELKNFLYGTKRPSTLPVIGAICIAPGALSFLSRDIPLGAPFLILLLGASVAGILWNFLSKSYAVGLTNRRLLVLRLSSSQLPKAVGGELVSYDLGESLRVTGKVGGLSSHLRIDVGETPFRADVPQFYPGAKEHYQAIAEALNAKF